jgi:hypothetical protein
MKRALMILVALGTIGWFAAAATPAQADRCHHGYGYRPHYSGYYPQPRYRPVYRPPVHAHYHRHHYRPHHVGYGYYPPVRGYYPGNRGYVSFGFGF